MGPPRRKGRSEKARRETGRREEGRRTSGMAVCVQIRSSLVVFGIGAFRRNLACCRRGELFMSVDVSIVVVGDRSSTYGSARFFPGSGDSALTMVGSRI
ncbi:hypothetical protein Droror1_Dr00027742 [Drosera rotundifolia]